MMDCDTLQGEFGREGVDKGVDKRALKIVASRAARLHGFTLVTVKAALVSQLHSS